MFSVQGLGGVGREVQDLGLRVLGFGFSVLVLGLRVQV